MNLKLPFSFSKCPRLSLAPAQEPWLSLGLRQGCLAVALEL